MGQNKTLNELIQDGNGCGWLSDTSHYLITESSIAVYELDSSGKQQVKISDRQELENQRAQNYSMGDLLNSECFMPLQQRGKKLSDEDVKNEMTALSEGKPVDEDSVQTQEEAAFFNNKDLIASTGKFLNGNLEINATSYVSVITAPRLVGTEFKDFPFLVYSFAPTVAGAVESCTTIFPHKTIYRTPKAIDIDIYREMRNEQVRKSSKLGFALNFSVSNALEMGKNSGKTGPKIGETIFEHGKPKQAETNEPSDGTINFNGEYVTRYMKLSSYGELKASMEISGWEFYEVENHY